MWGKNQILVGSQIYPGEPGTIWASIEWLYTVSPQLIDFLGVSTLAHVSNKLDSEREILQLNWEDCHIDHIVPLAAFNQNKGAILFAIILNVSCVSGRGACQSSITCYKILSVADHLTKSLKFVPIVFLTDWLPYYFQGVHAGIHAFGKRWWFSAFHEWLSFQQVECPGNMEPHENNDQWIHPTKKSCFF